MDERIADIAGNLRRHRSLRRYTDRRELPRELVDLRVVEGIVGAAVVLHPALPEHPDDAHRLAEHIETHRLRRRKGAPGDVLVQVLPRPEAELEPSRHQGCRGCGSLCDDRRMVTHQRAGHAGGDLDPRCGLGYTADGAPGKSGTPVSRDPRVIMVADVPKREPGVFGEPCVLHQLGCAMRPGEEFVPISTMPSLSSSPAPSCRGMSGGRELTSLKRCADRDGGTRGAFSIPSRSSSRLRSLHAPGHKRARRWPHRSGLPPFSRPSGWRRLA